MSTPTRVLKVFPKALSFDGVDDYVEVPYPINTSELTVEVWVLLRSLGRYRTFVVKRNDSVVHAVVWLQYYAFTTHFHFVLYDGTRFYRCDSDITPQPFKWYHVVGTFKRPTIKIYVNSSLRNTATADIPLPSGSRWYIGVGWYNNGFVDWFDGLIALVRIYSRSLSDSEVYQLYAHPLRPPLDGLVLWLSGWPEFIHDGVWWDASGYNNHGTIYGAQVVDV